MRSRILTMRLAYAPGSRALWILLSALIVAAMAYVRLVVFPDRIVPLAYGLPLLLFLWRRDLVLLWAMAVAFCLILSSKMLVLLTTLPDQSGSTTLFFLMQLAGILAPAFAVHWVVVLSRRLEKAAADLESALVEMEAANEELAAREEEISQQNEELLSQTAELEYQTEELSAQSEELQRVNDQLLGREETLHAMISLSATGAGEEEVLENLGKMLRSMLSARCSAAAILTPRSDTVTVRGLFGVESVSGEIERATTLATIILATDRAGYIPDLELRPDIAVPILAGGVPARSVIAAPARMDGAESMVLEVYSRTPGPWSDRDLQLMQWCADQCGRFWTTSRLREDLERLADSERAARSKAERAAREKDEFVATLAHELRTPIGATLGWANLLRTISRDPRELDKGLEVIERNSRHQARLISDLLDISRATRGKLEIVREPVRLAHVVSASIDVVRPAAEAREIALERSEARDGRTIVIGDPDRLQQVVWNLLTNAVKFTEPGGRVEVHISHDTTSACIRVTDNGKGIDPDLLPHVFDRYQQADSSSSRAHGGLGLGLAIVKHLVELHGGSVRIDSEGQGKGTSCFVTLPLALPEEAAGRNGAGSPAVDRAAATRLLQGLPVLVVDDDPDILEFTARLLKQCGAEVSTASSGVEALAELERRSCRLLISDIGMPGMDGYEMIRRIRKHESDEVRSVWAIAMTAFSRAEDRARALTAGFQEHLPKPVDASELVAAIGAVRGEQRGVWTEAI
jgi:signal transduction histidine kinase/ActR/RegA family two-component response regulator